MAHRSTAGMARPVAPFARPDGHDLVVSVGLGLGLEAVPVALAVVVGPPVGLAIAPFGFIVAWSAILGGRRADGRLSASDAVRSVGSRLVRLCQVYVFAVGVALVVAIAALLVGGLVLGGPLALAGIAAAVIAVLTRFAYVIPCLTDGDDVITAFERARLLWHAAGRRRQVQIVLLLLAGLGPSALVAITTADRAPGIVWLATLGLLAVMGPLPIVGLERLRDGLETAARNADPTYARP